MSDNESKVAEEETKPAIEPSTHDQAIAEIDKLGVKQYISIMLVDDEEGAKFTAKGHPAWHYEALVGAAKQVAKHMKADIDKLPEADGTTGEGVRAIKEGIVKSANSLVEFVKAELNVSTDDSDVAH